MGLMLAAGNSSQGSGFMANEEHLARLREGVDAWNAWWIEHLDMSADLMEANLSGTDLSKANLIGANLIRADLSGSNLIGADLSGSNLSEAELSGSHLSAASLSGANLSGANLSGADLHETIFANINLSTVKGLEACLHWGPSILDHRTLQRSGRLPLPFLRGCGLSDWEIEAAKLHEPSLTSEQITDIVYRVHDLRSTRPIQIHRLFISYSHADSVFLEHMERHLNERGIRFWRDKHDAPAGPLENIILRAIRHNPTVLLVLSENSVKSDWVEYEAQTARELEKELGRHVLCPVALDESWKTCKWSAVLRNQIKKYNVLNFSDWQDATAFEGKFQHLLSGIDLFYGDDSPFPQTPAYQG
jgi:hypothetical protein